MAKPLYVLVVRAGKDRDAVNATIERFYNGWPVKVVSLGGTRDPGEALERIRSILREYKHSFVLFLGGREDSKLVEAAADIADERFAAIRVAKKRVRNARLEEIHWWIEKARSKLRLRIGVIDSHILVHRVGERHAPESYVIDEPYADVFLATSGWVKHLKRLGCSQLTGDVIIERLEAGLHHVYAGGSLACKLRIPDEGAPSIEKVGEGGEARIEASTVEKVAKSYEAIAEELLREAYRRAEEQLGYVDAIVVPWSGGKDSTIALYIAKRVFHDVIAVYVDTGVDFPHTREYIEKVSEQMKVKLVYAYAPIRENLRRLPRPTHENRWCTGLKLEALRRALASLGERLLVVTGDRDAESEPRSRRPPIRLEEDDNVLKIIVSPLKQWSTLLLQLYARIRGVELNPLYEYGFYRLGCYICPALRSWERMLITREPLVASLLVGRPFYKLGRLLSQG